MNSLILGIDPGLSGGLAWVDAQTGKLHRLERMPLTKDGKLDGQLLSTLMQDQDYENLTVRAYVELVTSRPRQAGQFNFGINTGMIHGVLYALDIPFQLVTPAKWKSVYGIKREEGETKSQKKTEARQIAAHLFPDHAEQFKRVKDDGVAEAALIALYGLNLYVND